MRIVEDAARLDGIRKKDIADRINSNPSQVSRWLSGPSNWTIDSVSDVLWAVGGELDFNFVCFADRAKQNRSHPINEIDIVNRASQVNTVVSTANRIIPHSTSITTSSSAVVSVTLE